jgi:hypothetical protein
VAAVRPLRHPPRARLPNEAMIIVPGWGQRLERLRVVKIDGARLSCRRIQRARGLSGAFLRTLADDTGAPSWLDAALHSIEHMAFTDGRLATDTRPLGRVGHIC